MCRQCQSIEQIKGLLFNAAITFISQILDVTIKDMFQQKIILDLPEIIIFGQRLDVYGYFGTRATPFVLDTLGCIIKHDI